MKRCYLFTLLVLTTYSCQQSISTQKITSETNTTDIGKKIIIYSTLLSEDREILVYQPSGFYGMDEQQVRYPVVYVMDGESQFLTTVGVVQQLSSPGSANDVAPQMMVVGIVNTNRNRDLTPTSAIIGKDTASLQITGGAGRMARFISEELIPHIDSRYPTTPHRTLVGHSLGGLFVLNTLIKNQELFQNYLAIDPFLRWDDQRFAHTVLEALESNNFNNKKLYIATANTSMSWMDLQAIRKDTTEVTYMMRSNLDFREKMQSSQLGIDYQNKYYDQENHFQVPLIATYDGFRYFYDFYSFPEIMDYYHPAQKDRQLVDNLKAHYQNSSQKMGYPIVPMESYINSWAFGFISFEHPELARQLLDLNIENYPNSPIPYRSKGYFLLGQGDTTSAVTYFEKTLDRKDMVEIRQLVDQLKGD